MRILIVEDNRNLARGLRHNLAHDGHEVDVAYTGEQALAHVRQHSAALELVLLDVMIPKPDGFEVLRAIRADRIDVPVIVLTARGEEDDLVRGLRLGADDYMTKPFSVLELIARVDAVRRRATRWRRRPADALPTLTFGDVRIDTTTHTVTRNGVPVALRPMEYQLLLELARRQGQVASRRELLEAVWGYGQDVVSRTVDTHIRQLRQKLEDDADEPQVILTVRKAGYRLTAAGGTRSSGR
jgi:two-component system, OmpR family, alkaline phosphatase synthesis response regulator PhoP